MTFSAVPSAMGWLCGVSLLGRHGLLKDDEAELIERDWAPKVYGAPNDRRDLGSLDGYLRDAGITAVDIDRVHSALLA
jgi:hypothetical protein